MKHIPRAAFVEIYLHQPEKLAKLEPHQIKFYWDQRSWHPVIRMQWLAGLDPNILPGHLSYPDGSVFLIPERANRT